MRTADPVKIQRIIETAAQLFAERHYHEVRMDDIADKAGVAKGTIYLHFKDKDDLYRALALDSLKKLCNRMRESLVGLDDPAAKLLSVNRKVIEFFEHHTFTLDLINQIERLQDQAGCAGDAFIEVRDEFKNILQSILGEFPEAGRSTDDELFIAFLAMAGMNKEILRQLPRPWPKDLADQLTRLFLEGFLRCAPVKRSPARGRGRRRVN